jgi:hypothetical protein
MTRRSGPLVAVVLAALVITLLVASAGRADARDCRAEVPMPADLSLIAPAADAPSTIARFSGAWLGTWSFDADRDTLCAALVVEEVFPNGYARVIYSHGTWGPHKIHQPGVYRATGKIVDGVLRFSLPVPSPPAFVYRFSGGALSGTYRGRGDHAAARVSDLDTLGCPATIPAVGPTPLPAGARDRLTAEDLLEVRSAADDGPVHNDYFMPLGRPGPARHSLKGTLSVPASSMSSAHRRCRALDVATPAFSIDVFTHGEHLVPVVRDIVAGTLIVSPGRVWAEPGDRGMSRASFPFVLVNGVNNATHNGLATFLFDATRVSPLRFQVVQETAEWAKHDYWGRVPMTYTPRELAGETALRARFDDERRRRAPLRPWSALAAAREPALHGIDGDVPVDEVSVSGLVVDGTVYVRGCNTRYGPYPYCREMRHGAFSVTKSLGGAVALLRLAQKYGDEVFDARIKDYVTVTATHDGWDGVTFADALSMATGIGEMSPERQPNDFAADENKPRMLAWLLKRTAREKLEAAFAFPRYPWPRGEVFRYNSTHTFVLAAAMDGYLKRKSGPNAHLWDMVTAEVLQPIGIFAAPMMHTGEVDGSRGIPLMGYGLYPTVDDVAKLTTLLQNGGRHGGRQLLSRGKLAEALYRVSPSNGLPLGRPNRFGEPVYHLSFWSMPYRTASGCFVQIPYMAGYGGNVVALLPNGVSAFRFADAMIYDVPALIRAGETVRPLCTSAATGAPPARSPMTASELRAELPARTFVSEVSRWTLEPSGTVWGEAKRDFDVGHWHITDDAKYCRTWHVWERGLPGCFAVYRDGETFEFHSADRWTLLRVQRMPLSGGR